MRMPWTHLILFVVVIFGSSCTSSPRTFSNAKWDKISANAYDEAFETAIVWKFVREERHIDYVSFITPA